MRKKLSVFLILFIGLMVSANTADARKKPPKPPEIYYTYSFEQFNDPPGTYKFDIFNVQAKKEATSRGIISPDLKMMAYTKVFFYPQEEQTASKLFYVPLPDLKNLNNDALKTISSIESPLLSPSELLSTGVRSVDKEIFRTFTPVDWSINSRKLLIKETIGEHQRGIWATAIWVYDFDTRSAKRLDELRKAVIYYWRNKQSFYLDDYRWSIEPLGWDTIHPNRVVANIYGYNDVSKVFLGCWSIDSNGMRSTLLSVDNQNYPVGKYGLLLKVTAHEKKQ